MATSGGEFFSRNEDGTRADAHIHATILGEDLERDSLIVAALFSDMTPLTDAQPRTLYVRRDVINTEDIIAWANEQDLPTLNDDLHVTLMYSRTPVDWMKVGSDYNGTEDGTLIVPPGGVRIVERLSEVIALLFTSSTLSWRHEQIKRDANVSWDWPDYQPHITLFKSAGSEALDMPDAVEPYRSKIVLGPEIFEEINE